MTGESIGYYALPVIPSMEGIDGEVNKGMSKLLGKFGDLGKKTGQDLGKGIGDGLKSAQVEVENATKSYEKLRDKAADALDKITVEEKKLAKARAGGKEDMIAAAEARLAKARRDSARASKESQASHSHLLDVQLKLGNSSGDLGDKLGLLGGAAARIGPAVAALGAAAGAAAVGGVALLAAGAVTATRELYQLGAQWDDISDNLRIKTGATGGALDDLTESVKRIGQSVPVGLGSLADTAAEVNRSLHLTGPELEAVAGAVAELGRLTGEDVDVRQLGKAFRAFGVEAKDQVAALDQLFNAGKQTGIGVNELIDNVVKGGPALRQLGLGFGESAALATQFEEAGLDGTKMMAGLSKGLAIMADKGLTGGKSFQELIGGVRDLMASGKDAAALDMANSLFGAKGGAQFFEAIRNGALDLDTLTASMSASGETIAQASEGTADWSERWELLKNEAIIALEPLGTTVFNFVNEKLGALADWVSTHHDEIVDAFVTIGQSVVTAGQVALRSLGEMVQGFGELIIPIGNVVGAIRKADAWIAEMSGDTEKAEMFREQSEAAFGWGEGLQDAGQKMIDFAEHGEDLKRDLKALGEQSKTTGGETSVFGDAVRAVGDDASGAVDPVNKLHDAMNQQLIGGGFAGQFSDTMADLPGLIGGGFGALPAGPTTPGGGGLLGGAGGATGRTGSESGLQPNTVGAKRAVEAAFPEIQSIGGWRPPDGYNEHFNGQALDIMIPNWSSPGGKQYGDKVAQYLLANASALGVDYVLWQQRQWNADGTSSAMGDRGSPTQNHMDHVHAHTVNTPNLPGAQAPKTSPSAGGMTSLGSVPTASLPSAATGPSTASLPAAPASSSPINFGANVVDQQLVDAFGPEYQPGIGTPGFDEDGTPGYYRVDPRALAQAGRRVEDSQQAIADADQRLLEAKERQAELEDDILASAEDRAQAAREVARAEQATKRVRQDALWAQEDADEAARGRFTAAKKATKTKDTKNGRGGSSELDGIGGIFGSFLKETFGLDGSLFPDISNLMPVQMAGAALGAFQGPLQGALDGKLGIQQPGWTPDAGDPFAGAADGGGSGTSGLPFGMIPGISSVLPDMAEPGGPAGMHNGSGAQPGPADQSTHITINNPQGDENSIADRTRRTIMRTPRTGTYTAPSAVGGG